MDIRGLLSIDLRQKANKRETILFGIALIIFLLVFVKTCWIPSRTYMASAKKEFVSLEVQKSQLQKLSNSPEAIQKIQEKDVYSTLQGKKILLGTPQELQNSIEAISQFNLFRGVQLVSIKFSDLEKVKTLVRKKIEMTLSGKFHTIGQFLYTLESRTSPLIIEDFSMELNDVSLSQVNTEIKGSFYAKNF